jgi:hypothetical protein
MTKVIFSLRNYEKAKKLSNKIKNTVKSNI